MKHRDATITCPLCATATREVMPENSCQHFYRCTGCGQLLRPKDGDCCVFCSYASTTCPPRLAETLDGMRRTTVAAARARSVGH